jgi:type IX secretion system PorP/SprF family membrane protein
MQKKIFIFFLFCCSLQGFAQQDAQYSQYMFDQLALNPAYAGSRDVLNAALLVRDQWTGIDGAPKTAVLTLQGPLKSKRVGLGLQIISDNIGPKSVTGALASYSYRLPLGNGKLAMGLRGGIYNYNYDWSKIEYRDPNEKYLKASEQYMVPTADAGVYYHTHRWYAGLSASHLIHSRITDVQNAYGKNAELYTHYFANFGIAFQLSESVVFNPTCLVKITNNVPPSADLNLNFLFDQKLWLGVSLRKNYGIVFLAQYNIIDNFKIGYAYDLGFNDLGRNHGTHELMLQYDFNIFQSRIVSPRYL